MAFYTDFAGHYEKVFPFRQTTLDFLDRWLPPEGHMLDIGCGTGHYCAGVDGDPRSCLGIDLDPGMINRAEELYPDSRFRILGMEEIGLLERGSFQGIFCIGNVLPHLPAAGLAGFVLDVKKLLAPGGVWIFQTVNFDPLLRTRVQDHRFPVLRLEEENLEFHRWYEDIEGGSLRFHTQLVAAGDVLFQGETALTPHMSVEYLLGHQAAGFELLGHFGDFTGSAFDPSESRGSIFVWRRG